MRTSDFRHPSESTHFLNCVGNYTATNAFTGLFVRITSAGDQVTVNDREQLITDQIAHTLLLIPTNNPGEACLPPALKRRTTYLPVNHQTEYLRLSNDALQQLLIVYKKYTEHVVLLACDAADIHFANQVKLLFRTLDFLSNNPMIRHQMIAVINSLNITDKNAVSLFGTLTDAMTMILSQLHTDATTIAEAKKQLFSMQKLLILAVALETSKEESHVQKLRDRLGIPEEIAVSPSSSPPPPLLTTDELEDTASSDNAADPFGLFEPTARGTPTPSVFMPPLLARRAARIAALQELLPSADEIVTSLTDSLPTLHATAATRPSNAPSHFFRRSRFTLNAVQLLTEAAAGSTEEEIAPPAPRFRRTPR